MTLKDWNWEPWVVAPVVILVLAFLVYAGAQTDYTRKKNCLWAAENSIEAYKRFCAQ